MFAGDRKLRVSESELSFEDFSVFSPTETWVKLPDALGHVRSAGGMLL